MTAHVYWRMLMTSSVGGNSAAVATLGLYATLGSANLAVTGNGTASTGYSNGPTYAADKAFDGNPATCWMGNSFGITSPQWLLWQFPTATSITAASITNWTLDTTTTVATAILQWSDDGVSFTDVFPMLGNSTAAGATTTFTRRAADAALLCPPPGLFASGGANAPSLRASPPALAGYGGANSYLLGPVPTLTSYAGGGGVVSCPRPTLIALGHDSTNDNAAYLAAPRPTLSAYCGANATLGSPAPTLSITATITIFGAAALRAPAGLVSATGTVSGTATAGMRAPMATLVGYFGAVCSLTLSGSPTVSASGTTGGVGGADIRGPSPRLVSSGTAHGYGFANLRAPAGHLGATARAWITAPSPMMTATGYAVVAATYEAYAINLNHAPGDQAPVDEVTHYTNFPFNGIVRYQSSYYGWGADGLYLLEGAMDDANEIPYAVRTCVDDFKLTNKKNVVSAYFAGRIGPDMTVTLYAGEDGQASYNYHTANGSQARTHREKFARGVTDRYFAIGVSGNSALELADIELEINKLKRKT